VSLRRYAVRVEREAASAVMMHPAPGYDDHLPHDLVHFVAEAEWGLDGAVLGQLAAGGDAGTFWLVDQELLGKAMWRRRMRRRRHYKGGRRSELLAEALELAWKHRYAKSALPSDWDERLLRARVDPQQLERVVGSLEELATRWHRLQPGELAARRLCPGPARRGLCARRAAQARDPPPLAGPDPGLRRRTGGEARLIVQTSIGTCPGSAATRSSQPRTAGYGSSSKPPSWATCVYA
jgi:hypothetical protein